MNALCRRAHFVYPGLLIQVLFASTMLKTCIPVTAADVCVYIVFFRRVGNDALVVMLTAVEASGDGWGTSP